MALPVNGSTHLIPAYYSFYRPRKDERLSWPSWLTCSGWLTHISGHPSAAGRAQDRESSSARDRRSTTVPRHQPYGRYGSESTREIIILGVGVGASGGAGCAGGQLVLVPPARPQSTGRSTVASHHPPGTSWVLRRAAWNTTGKCWDRRPSVMNSMFQLYACYPVWLYSCWRGLGIQLHLWLYLFACLFVL